MLAAGTKPKLAHIIPNFQNPAGYTLSAPKRERLLELARSYEFTVFEDDPYVSLRFEGESLPTMVSTDPETVVYASSFSKTVCPGIRVGYLVGSPELIARIVKIATSTYISPSMVSQGIVNQFCRSGAIDRSIATVRDALRERAQTLCRALSEKLPDARFVAPEGGYFLWVDLPRGSDVNALFDAAAARNVQFVKGSDFLLEGGESSLRLAYSGVTPEQIEEGIDRLAEAYAEVGRARPCCLRRPEPWETSPGRPRPVSPPRCARFTRGSPAACSGCSVSRRPRSGRSTTRSPRASTREPSSLTGALVKGGAHALSLTRPPDAPSLEQTPRGRVAVGAIQGAWGDMLERRAASWRGR